MKTMIVLVFLILSVSCSMQSVESQQRNESPQPQTSNLQSKPTVLVELFTSEGCSSCPSADKILAFLQREQPVPQAEIITLAFHVDYWDYLGWKDEFSSAEFSKRQESYGSKFNIDSIYTPQMIVDGQTEFVGNNSGKAVNSIMSAAKMPKAKIELALNENLLKINISEISKTENAMVYAAIAENNLSTQVKRGENSGRVLEHSSVVRELKNLGVVSGENSTFSTEFNLPMKSNWKKENLKIIVFVQENESRKILGANQFQYK